MKSKSILQLSCLICAGVFLLACATQPPHPLHIAASEGDLDKIKTITLQNEEIRQLSNNKGYTALHIAARQGHLDIVQYLLSQGIEVDLPDRRGHTALHLAVWGEHETVVDLLISQGANVNHNKGKGQPSPLHVAARRGNTVIAEKLLKAGADVNLRDANRQNPIELARLKRDFDFVDFLEGYEAQQ